MIFILIVLVCYSWSSALALDSQNETCKSNITNLNNQVINYKKYCVSQPCVTKCCGANEVLYKTKINGTSHVTCTNVNDSAIIALDLKKTNITLDFSNLNIYKSNIQTDINKATNKEFSKRFTLVQNKMFVDENCGSEWPKLFNKYLLENGKMAGDFKNFKIDRWNIQEPLTFCVELKVGKYKNGSVYKFYTYYVAREPESYIDTTFRRKFTGWGTAISSLFLFLVLLVYCALPELQTLSGMLLMAYLATLLVVDLIKTVDTFKPEALSENFKIFGPTFYFMVLSSFLWLNTISFDIWWTFRSMRCKREINRIGESRIKFLWYSLFVWGVTTTITAIAVIIDHSDLTEWPNIIKPPFDSFFEDNDSTAMYLYVPIGIMTLMNIVLFLMTVYNIWLSRKELNDVARSYNSTKQTQIRFRVFIKLSLLMGISWVLEVVQVFFGDDISDWLFIVMNLYNALLGVAIFFMFICQKSTLDKLCKRFNIKNMKFKSSTTTTRSTLSRSQPSKSSSYLKRTTAESDIEMYETTTVNKNEH